MNTLTNQQKTLKEFIVNQAEYEKNQNSDFRKQSGIFFTNNIDIIETIASSFQYDNNILKKLILEPACGHGIFILALILKAYQLNADAQQIRRFIENNIYFVDIDHEMVNSTKKNIANFYSYLFGMPYIGNFNAFCLDFTKKLWANDSAQFYSLYGSFDLIIGNPPYITLYGRRDKKINEEQRVYYLNNYSQFPSSVKNGKINYVMLFIEHGLDFLKPNGTISFIVDMAFLETAYKYTRKFLLENTKIQKIVFNLQGFESVASGQIIFSAKKSKNINGHKVLIIDADSNKHSLIRQNIWLDEKDEYKFRLNSCSNSSAIIKKICANNDMTLKELYPRKNLRTCVMLLNMEDKFTTEAKPSSHKLLYYPYYQGSKSIKYKYCNPEFSKYFRYDKELQDIINDELKAQLEKQGVKNKKRIGFGETIIYDNPKVFIRQSAKEIIATYDETSSSANNSLYVFSMRNRDISSIQFLKFFCGLLNSSITSFYAQQRRIIRYSKGKQPQIKTSDLYQIKIPSDKDIQTKIAKLVDSIYSDRVHADRYKYEIDKIMYSYYNLNKSETSFIEKSISDFLR